MKVTITQPRLVKTLTSMVRVATTNTTLPILSSVLIEATGSKITFTTTNLEQAIVVTEAGKIESEGRVSLPLKIFTELVSSLPSHEDIHIEKNGTTLTVATKSSSSKINVTNDEDFPQIPKISQENVIRFGADVLKKSLSQTLFSVSKDETRQILNGVFMNSTDTGIVFASTDSYRLSERSVEGLDGDVSIIIPTEALQDIYKLLDDGEVEIAVEETQLSITYKNTQIISRLIPGEYPDYRQLIPEQKDQSIVVDKKELLSALKTISVFAKESAGGVKLVVDEQKQSIVISSIATQVGENEVSVEATIKGDGEQTINSRYLMDSLNALSGEDVTMFFNDKLAPLVIGSEDSTHTQLIMPLKS